MSDSYYSGCENRFSERQHSGELCQGKVGELLRIGMTSALQKLSILNAQTRALSPSAP